jgi:hypothetical protein
MYNNILGGNHDYITIPSLRRLLKHPYTHNGSLGATHKTKKRDSGVNENLPHLIVACPCPQFITYLKGFIRLV